MIPNEEPALRIAFAIFEDFYDKRWVAAGQPYKTIRDGDQWWVISGTGSPNTRGGGHPELALAAKDGRVLSIALSR